MNAVNATPHTELITELMNPNNPKNEREHAAVREVERLQEALAQPEQEPVAWRTFDGEGGYDYRSYEDNESYADDWNKRNPNHAGWVDKLYTHSQPEQKPVVCCQQYDTCLQPCTPRGEHLVRRKWVGLTDEEIDAIYTGVRAVHHEINSDLFARAIESKLKEVNT